MSKQTRLPLDNRDVSRFFNNSVYNRSIKLWVNNTCFTCSRLILAQHSNIFEQHLRDSPPSVLLEDFHNVEGAETAIQDALILLYGGSVAITMENINILSKFANIYNIKELMKVCLGWIEHNLCVENVMMFFKTLSVVDGAGVIDVPDVINKFMEDNTRLIVDHLLSSSDNIDDEFLLAMLELPSSSILVQRCLKSGILPDPIVDLIFKHSNTINVNFLLHDDKRTYVRLITILKSKARSYKDMEKIIDIQQKCISKMCHPYGSYDSLAIPLTPAPSIATISKKQQPPPSKHNISHMYVREESAPISHHSREEGAPIAHHSLPRSERHTVPHDYRANSFERQMQQQDESEYLMPEELKHRQNRHEYHEPQSFVPYESNPEPSQHPQPKLLSNFSNDRTFNRDHRDVPDKSFTSQTGRAAPTAVTQRIRDLEKTFVPKYPEQPLSSHPAFHSKYDDNKEELFSDAETLADHHPPVANFGGSVNNRMKSLSLGKENMVHNSEPKEKTNYAQVYMKKAQLAATQNERVSDKINNLARHQAQNELEHQNEIQQALNKLAEQQAFIEHTYDNMSIASGRLGMQRPVGPPSDRSETGHTRSIHPDSSGVSRNTSMSSSRRRTYSEAKRNAMLAAESVTDFEDIPPTKIVGSRLASHNSSTRKPIHIPTTFHTAGSMRGSKPPTPPSHPPPNSSGFFGGGGTEAKPPPIERPPPKLHCPPPPLEHNNGDMQQLDALSSIDYSTDMPLECLPEHDRMTSPPVPVSSPPGIMSPEQVLSPGSSRPMSPTIEVSNRSRARDPAWFIAQKPPTIDTNKLTVPKNEGPKISKEQILAHSAVLLNKRSLSKERARSKERSKSMRKKKGERRDVSVPMSFLEKKEVKTLEHPTKNRPKKAAKRPPTRARSHDRQIADKPSSAAPPRAPSPEGGQPPPGHRKPAPYHIKVIPSNIPGNFSSTV